MVVAGKTSGFADDETDGSTVTARMGSSGFNRVGKLGVADAAGGEEASMNGSGAETGRMWTGEDARGAGIGGGGRREPPLALPSEPLLGVG